MMIDFIDKLQHQLDTEIIQSSQNIRGNNSFDLDDEGNLINLFLHEVALNTLDVLLPIADSLIELTIRDGNITCLNQLRHFSRLEKLNLSFNSLLEDTIVNLNYLTNLKVLDLSATDLTSTQLLANLEKLEELYLGLNCDIDKVEGLEALKELKAIDLQSSDISSIDNINLSNTIHTINLKSTEIEEIIGFEKFPNLTSLNLSSNKVAKIQGLDGLNKLEKLNISSSWITQIEGLEHLINLEVLDMSNQEIEKIVGLDSLVNLRKLNLAEDKLTKVECLDALNQLEYLLLDCNPIKTFDAKFLSFLKTSCFISLCHTNIKKIEAVVPSNVDIQFENPKYMPKTLF